MPYKDKDKQRECQRIFSKSKRTSRRNTCLEYLGNKCSNCSSVENLEFHHTDPYEKHRDINEMWHFPMHKLTLEVEKCVLLCKSCHMETYSNNYHGSVAMYKKGCKCDDCRKANTFCSRMWRARRKKSLS